MAPFALLGDGAGEIKRAAERADGPGVVVEVVLDAAEAFHLVVPSQGVTSVNRQHWLDMEIFAPLQHFEQAHAVTGSISPTSPMTGALFERSNGFLPQEVIVN
jgi:hypothetical protein